MVQVLYSNLNHAVALPVCLRLLSSCRGKLFFVAPSIFSSPLTNFHVITEEKHLHTMMLPPLYLYISEILKRIMHHIPSSSQLCSTLCFAITYNHNNSTLKTLGPMGQNMKEAKKYA
ncbi:hypothetical protein ATANTOWER_018207 [Ataeniobius toweri]|uniref:Uncharacterized protein n=1 Tax=Ataeniobius toweri TaxID=208326 RepID=A0ABU7B263_9TELE|nr:hypothetical protein [Ataeniobius toweri]